jgi:carbamoyl-phosphate synthase small subunit
VSQDGDKQAVVVLDDGTVARGTGFGAVAKVAGEVVFNTGMVGYTESITDPSYQGQILIQTYPLIGNYGVSSRDFESDGPKIEGYVIHELCRTPSHWSSVCDVDSWLETSGVPGIERADTRKLTKHIRINGTMLGILQVYERGDPPDIGTLVEEARRVRDPNERALAYEVATDRVQHYNPDGDVRVALIDCGVKTSAIRNLTSRNVHVVRFPPKTSVADILRVHPSGVVVSSGPGDPKLYRDVIGTTLKIIEANLPVFGICLGCQIIALALGGDTYKLKFGHRGQNHPCIDLETKRCFITSQNHGYAIDGTSIQGRGLDVAFINANDRTVEGIRHHSLPVIAAQFHPEASPGPNDTNGLFDEFLGTLRPGRRGINAQV